MTFRAPGRARRAAPIAAILAALGLLALSLPPLARAGSASAPVRIPGAATNAQLLQGAVQAVANRLVGQAPLTPGTRVALRPESDQPLDGEVAEALLEALNTRRIDCVLLPPLPAPEGGAPAAPAAPTGPGGGAGAPGSSSSAPGGLGAFAQLQAERAAQAARADSLANPGAVPRPAGGSAASSVLASGAAADLAVLSYRVSEARVDYVRQFRGGLFGAQRIQRRGSARIALRLAAPGSDAVRWSAAADTSVGDVVMKSELAALEDRQRPETRPVPPSSGIGKIVEPVLVVALIAGLVSLFYQNRP